MQISRLATTPEGARQIALSGQSYSQTLRALAWRTLLRLRNRNVQRAQPLDMQRTDLLAELQAECPWPHEVAQ